MTTILLSAIVTLACVTPFVPRNGLFAHNLRWVITGLIATMVILTGDPVSETYQVLIFAGLMIWMLGDLQLLAEEALLMRLLSAVVTFTFYTVAFLFESESLIPKPAENVLTLPAAVFLAIASVIVYQVWRPYFSYHRNLILIHFGLMVVMVWAALNRWLLDEHDSTILAASGALLFLSGDLLGFFQNRRMVVHVIAVLYIVGHTLVAASV